MFSNLGMRNADNENEPFSFESLAQVTARLFQGDDPKSNERPADSAEQQHDEKRAEQQRRYVDQRLRELAAFEARARGGRRKRQ